MLLLSCIYAIDDSIPNSNSSFFLNLISCWTINSSNFSYTRTNSSKGRGNDVAQSDRLDSNLPCRT